jgi:hypothetical protein
MSIKCWWLFGVVAAVAAHSMGLMRLLAVVVVVAFQWELLMSSRANSCQP